MILTYPSSSAAVIIMLPLLLTFYQHVQTTNRKCLPHYLHPHPHQNKERRRRHPQLTKLRESKFQRVRLNDVAPFLIDLLSSSLTILHRFFRMYYDRASKDVNELIGFYKEDSSFSYCDGRSVGRSGIDSYFSPFILVLRDDYIRYFHLYAAYIR